MRSIFDRNPNIAYLLTVRKISTGHNETEVELLRMNWNPHESVV